MSWEVVGSIPVRDSDFFFVARLYHVDQFTLHISLPSLESTIFINLSLRLPALEMPYCTDIFVTCKFHE